MSAVAERLARATTLLFTPADSGRRLTKAFASRADIVIADLEDAIAPDAKQAARDGLAAFAWPAGPGPLRGVRINAPGTPEHAADLALVQAIGADVVMVPKADPAALARTDWPAPLMPIVETPAAVREAYAIARTPGVARILFGSIDLATTLGVDHRAGDDALLFARSSLVVDCAAAGIAPPMDGVHLELRNRESLTAECARARALGFTGKACLHPDQLDTVAQTFAPSAAEADWARRVVAAARAAAADGRGVTVVDGAMVDAPVLARAQALMHQTTTQTRRAQ